MQLCSVAAVKKIAHTRPPPDGRVVLPLDDSSAHGGGGSATPGGGPAPLLIPPPEWAKTLPKVHASLSHLLPYLFIKSPLQLLGTLLSGDWSRVELCGAN